MTVRTKLNPNIGNRVFSAHEAVKITSIVIFTNLLLSQYARFSVQNGNFENFENFEQKGAF